MAVFFYSQPHGQNGLVQWEGVCLSADTKPTVEGEQIPSGSTLLEMDTSNLYVLDHSSQPGTWRPVAIANSVLNPIQGTFTDKSATLTLGGTAQVALAANLNRRYLAIQNPSTAAGENIVAAETAWYSLTGTAVAKSPSYELLPGATFVWEGTAIPTNAVSVIAATTGHLITLTEL